MIHIYPESVAIVALTIVQGVFTVVAVIAAGVVYRNLTR